MATVLASTDALAWASILVKALVYAATLLAVGSVLVRLSLTVLDTESRGFLARIAAASAVAAACLSLLRLPLRAGFLMGGTLDGAIDPQILLIVTESPLGTSIALRLAGLALILIVLLPQRGAFRIAISWLAALGGVLAAASFAFRGHALEEPRLLLGALITLHILGLAFWIGIFAPLARVTRRRPLEEAGALAQEFGIKAAWIVSGLVVAGVLTLVFLGVVPPQIPPTPYGQAFLVKLALFACVFALAARNRLRLTPALLVATPGADARMIRAIRLEALLIAGILITTAALTTLFLPQ